MRTRIVAAALAVLALGSCSSDQTTQPVPATDLTTVPDTGGPDTGGPDTGRPDTSPAASSVPGTGTETSAPGNTAECTTAGNTEREESADPLLMSSMVGVDIRTGAHACFERLVIEFGGEGDFPGWSVEYVDDPVRLGESDEFVDIAGDATLQVVVRAWMPEPDGAGYDGEVQVFPTNVEHILELHETENFEGTSIWSIGLDAEYPFTVDVFDDPARLVIDISTG